MSFVIAAPDLVEGAAQDLSNIGSSSGRRRHHHFRPHDRDRSGRTGRSIGRDCFAVR